MADPQKPPQLLPPGREESRSMAMLSNALAIIGFIILIVIVVWGLVHIASLSSSSFGSLFSSSPKVTVTAPKNATSGNPIGISWKYTGKESGSYSFLYQCQQNFEFASGANGGQTKIPCGISINVGSSTSATILPVITPGAGAITVPVSIVFQSQDGKTRAEGTANIAVAPGSAPSSATTTASAAPTTKPAAKPPTKTTTYTPSTSYAPTYHRAVNLVAHAASGPADLRVALVGVGVIDPRSGALINRAPTSPYDIMGVEFDIANIGGSAAGGYVFTASLPTGPTNYFYTSPLQMPLRPGEHVLSTLRFAPNMRGGVITVAVDPTNAVIESNEGNNLVSQAI